MDNVIIFNHISVHFFYLFIFWLIICGGHLWWPPLCQAWQPVIFWVEPCAIAYICMCFFYTVSHGFQGFPLGHSACSARFPKRAQHVVFTWAVIRASQSRKSPFLKSINEGNNYKNQRRGPWLWRKGTDGIAGMSWSSYYQITSWDFPMLSHYNWS